MFEILTFLIFIILLFLIWWFALIKPERKKQKEHTQMLSSLKKGDYVITNIGMEGEIIEILTDNKIILKTQPDNVKLIISKNIVSSKGKSTLSKKKK